MYLENIDWSDKCTILELVGIVQAIGLVILLCHFAVSCRRESSQQPRTSVPFAEVPPKFGASV